MFDIVKRLLGQDNAQTKTGGAPAGAESILTAACALLLEMAAIDGEFSAIEQQAVLAILQQDYGVDANEASDIMAAAQAERARSIDLWRFTNIINEHYSRDDKLRVIETIWKVVYADGRLHGHEDHLVHTLATLLNLSHPDLIEAKLRVKNAHGI
ncbi:MAG: TerB family tellurite resistance protein [Syntrophaceae bacterium]